MTKRRVVITGMGILSPLGNDIDTSWKNILTGKSGVRTIDRVDTTGLTTTIGAGVDNFDPSKVANAKEVRRVDTFVLYAAEASRQALEDAGLGVLDDKLAPRAGCAIGSGIGGLCWIEQSYQSMLNGGPRKISPFFIPGTIINMAPGFASMKFNLQGPNISIVTACTTGAHNIGFAQRMIAYGDADIMVTGGTEMATSILGIGGFASARALSKRNDDPTKASRPWDKDRDGFVLGEGAGVLVLEEYEHAKKRGAKIYAELAGFGMSGDAYHMTAPEPNARGFTAAMTNTLNDAGLKPEDVQYVNAHGTSTLAADHLEALAVKKTFGDHAYKLAVSSTKSMTGHLLGAAGAVEAIFSTLAIRDQIAPPTINLNNPDVDCDLDFVPHKAREMKIDAVMSNSFGFGGTNGSLLIKKIED